MGPERDSDSSEPQPDAGSEPGAVDDPRDRESQIGAAPRVVGRERIRAGVRAALFGELEAEVAAADGEASSLLDVPERLGRFRVLGELGRGGMGEVYSAYDPELDRKVAIKLLRPDVIGATSSSAGPSRLQREAQAMARVNHPNVATVHEVGTFEGRLYVAMEYVQGGTLRQWLEREEPTAARIVAAFLQAGKGLAAAHEAGLIHRDFKPDNVLFGDDQRVRVVDFGLARAANVTQERLAVDPIANRGVDPLVTPLTQTGAVMGTPAYMSPEQHEGRPADARSDQFSFCVALWEALMGRRPFAGTTYAELMTNVVQGRRRDPQAGHEAPSRVVEALQRGLSRQPQDRFEDMPDLLAALAPPSRRLRWVAAGLTVAGIAVAGTWIAARETATVDSACAGVGSELDGIWDDGRRAAARKVVLDSGRPYAADAWSSIQRLLDDYADAWTQAAGEACAGARLSTADPEVYELRRRCLDSRRSELDELVGIFEEGDPAVVMEAVQAVMSLSDVRGCSDERRLAAWRVPRQPEAQRELAEIRARLGVAKVRGLTGRYEEAVDIAREAAARGRHLDDPATEAAALLIQGQYLERGGALDEAESVLARAVQRAEVADAFETRAKALNVLVYVVGQDDERWSEVKALASEARTVLRVMGSDPLLEAQLDVNLGTAARNAKRLEEARELHLSGLRSFEENAGDLHLNTASAHSNLGLALSELKRFEEADVHLRRALDGFETALGADHPAVGNVWNVLGTNAVLQDHNEEAVSRYTKALDIQRRNFPQGHRNVVMAYYNVGFALFKLRRYADAQEHFEAGASIRAELPGRPQGSAQTWATSIGACQLLRGQSEAAAETFDTLLADPQTKPNNSLRLYAAVAFAPTDPERARALAEQSLAELADDDVAERTEWAGFLAIEETLDQLRGLTR